MARGRSKKINIIIGTSIGNTTKQMKTVTQSVKELAGAVLSSKLTFAGLGVVVGAAISKFASLQTKMVNVGNLTNASTKEIQKMTKAISELSVEVGQPVEQLADGLFDVQSAGIAASKSIDFLRVSAKLATAGVTNTETAVDGLTSVINAYGLAAEDATEISDKFFAAQVEGKTTIAELSGSIGRLAPIARSAGISIDEMLAAVTTLTKAGVKTDEAVTSIRASLVAIIKPSKEAAEKAKELGIDFDVQALKAKGLTGVLQQIQEKTHGNTGAIATLLPQVKALTGVLSLAGEQSEEFVRIQGEVADSAGATETAFKKQTETIAFQLSVLSAEFRKFSDDTVAFWAPVLTKMLQFINGTQEAIDVTKKFSDAQFKNTKAFEQQTKERLILARQEVAEQEANIQKILSKVYWGRGKDLENARESLAEKKATLEEEKEFSLAFIEWKKEQSDAEKSKKKADAEEDLAFQQEMMALIQSGEEQLLVDFEKREEKKRKEEKKTENARIEALKARLIAETANANSIDEVSKGLARSIIDNIKQTLIAQLFAQQFADIAKIGSTIGVLLSNPLTWGAVPQAIASLAIPTAQVAVGVGAINAITPKFANGGIINPSPGGTTAIVGEAGESELILPESKLNDFLEKANVVTDEKEMVVNVFLDGKQLAQNNIHWQRQINRNKTR